MNNFHLCHEYSLKQYLTFPFHVHVYFHHLGRRRRKTWSCCGTKQEMHVAVPPMAKAGCIFVFVCFPAIWKNAHIHWQTTLPAALAFLCVCCRSWGDFPTDAMNSATCRRVIRVLRLKVFPTIISHSGSLVVSLWSKFYLCDILIGRDDLGAFVYWLMQFLYGAFDFQMGK